MFVHDLHWLNVSKMNTNLYYHGQKSVCQNGDTFVKNRDKVQSKWRQFSVKNRETWLHLSAKMGTYLSQTGYNKTETNAEWRWSQSKWRQVSVKIGTNSSQNGSKSQSKWR